jgi:23S rRNA (pseudouridine1915-N3)-methyltransferase
MKIQLIKVGKDQEKFITEGFDLYRNRIINYLTFEELTIPALKNTKNLSPEEVKQKEGELILKSLKDESFTVLLDEKGETFDSPGFANFIQLRMNSGIRQLNFVIGGAYGFSPSVHKKANTKISLSKMTFSHQIVRLIFMEQLYRALTILNNQPYHNA